MLANLRDTEDIPPLQPPLTPPSRSPASKVNDHDLGRPDDGNLTEGLGLKRKHSRWEKAEPARQS